LLPGFQKNSFSFFPPIACIVNSSQLDIRPLWFAARGPPHADRQVRTGIKKGLFPTKGTAPFRH
jgi:hypothetical protein